MAERKIVIDDAFTTMDRGEYNDFLLEKSPTDLYKSGREMTKRFEGFEEKVYLDPKANATIGYGINLEIPENREYFDPEVLTDQRPLTEEEGSKVFDTFYNRSIKDAIKFVGKKTFDKIGTSRQEILIDMAYNLGLTKLNDFDKMKSALHKGDYKTAADEMVDSDWYKEVGDRSKELVGNMRKERQITVSEDYADDLRRERTPGLQEGRELTIDDAFKDPDDIKIDEEKYGTITEYKPTKLEQVKETIGFAGKGAGYAALSSPQAFSNLIKEFGERAEPDISKDEIKQTVEHISTGNILATLPTVFKIAKLNFFKRTDIDERAVAKAQEVISKNQAFIEEEYPELLEQPSNKPEFWAYQLGAGVTSLAGAMGVTALTGSPHAGGILFGLYQKGSIYGELRDKDYSPEKAGQLSTIAGVIEGSLEYVGLDLMFKGWTGGWLINAGIRGATEGIQEFSQTLGENILMQKFGERPHEEFKDYFEGCGVSAVIGAALGMPSSVVIDFARTAGMQDKLIEKGFTPEEAELATATTLEGQKPEAESKLTRIINKLKDESGFVRIGKGEDITPEEQPKADLSQQAKGKSLEEFVGGQKVVYHQSQSKEPIVEFNQKDELGYKKAYYSQAGEGIYFSPNKEVVQLKYGKEGGQLVEAVLQPKKTLDLGDKDAMYFDGKIVNSGEIVVENFKRSQKGLEELPEPDIQLSTITKKAKKWLLEKGYDSAEGMKGEMWSAPEIVVLDKSIIKTKAQLKSIWEKAQEKPLEQEGKEIVKTDSYVPKDSEPFKFSFIRNTTKSANYGKRFGQDVEPHGRYMVVGDKKYIEGDKNWEHGIIEFKKPLVIDFGAGYEETSNWKNVLSNRYGGKTGASLTKAIKKDGYDGIVTISESQGTKYTSEVLDLTQEPPIKPPTDKPVEEIKVQPKKIKQDPSVGKVKPIIHKVTGYKDLSELISQKESILLKQQIKAEAKGAKEGFKAGKELIKRTESVKRRVTDIAQSLTRLAKRNLPQDYLDQVKSQLESVGLYQGRALKSKMKLQGFVLEQKNQGEVIPLSESEIALSDYTDLGTITLELLEQKHEIVKQLVHLGSLKNKLLSRKAVRDLMTTVKNMVTSIYNNTNTMPKEVSGLPLSPSQRKRAKKNIVFSTISAYFGHHRKVEFIAHSLDGFKRGAVTRDVIVPIQEAYNKEVQMTKKDTKDFKDNVKYTKQELQDLYTKEYSVGERKFTMFELMGIYLNSKNEGNRQRLVEGWKLTEEQIDSVKLDPKTKRIADFILDRVGGKWSLINNIKLKLTGRRMGKISGYFPIVIDKELASDLARLQAERQDLFQDMLNTAFVQKGFTEGRVGGRDAVDLDGLSVFLAHIRKVNHFISHALPVRDVQKIINRPEFKNAVTDAMGEEIFKQFKPWLKDIANPFSQTQDTAEKLVGKMRRFATSAILGLKFSVSLVQGSSITQTIKEIGFKNTIGGVMEFWKHPIEITKFIYDLSVQQENRANNFDRDVREWFESKDMKTFLSDKPGASEMFFSMIKAVDKATTLPSWYAAYLKRMKETNDVNESVLYADGVVRRTQPAGAVKDLSAMQKGSEFKKLWTMFYTHFSNYHNQMAAHFDYLKMSDDANLKKIGKSVEAYWWLLIAPAFLSTFLRSGGKADEEDYINALATYGFSGMIGIRDIVNSIVRKSPDSLTSPGISGLTEIGRLAQSLLKEDKKGKTIAKHATKSLGYITGLPTHQAWTTMEGIMDLAQGETKDPRRIFFSKYQLKEKKKKKEREFVIDDMFKQEKVTGFRGRSGRKIF